MRAFQDLREFLNLLEQEKQLLRLAAERVFLRKVGGGYVFTHRLLVEYFATLQPTDQARQTQTA